jgi:threonine dehydrogenase-like Zn-dependent dehydrogenase
MRAFVIRGPRDVAVEDVERPTAGRGEAVVDVARAGVCGTDHEFFTGEMAYLLSGDATYPMRIGHEWAGTVSAIGDGVDPSWLGRRVMGDTMLGDQVCDRCRDGRQHLCENRYEVGIRRGWPGALAEQVRVPAWSLHALPDDLDWTTAALVEPAGNAWRTVDAADLRPGRTLLVIGAGAIGLLASLIARAGGADVTVAGRSRRSIDFARSLGFATIASDALGERDGSVRRFDAVIDATNDPTSPARTVELVEPGRRIVWIGLSGDPSPVDSRGIVLRDVTAVGVLSGSRGLDGAIDLFGSGAVDPRPLVTAVVGLGDVGRVVAGDRDPAWGPGPKIHVDPRR